MLALSNRLAQAIVEGEVHVDDEGYAHDDEGNKWFAGKRFAGDTHRMRDVPMPPDSVASKRLDAMGKLPAHMRSSGFAASIMRQLKIGGTLTDKQRAAARRMFYQARLRDLAELFR